MVGATDCRSAGRWFNSGWKSFFTFLTGYDKLTNQIMFNNMSPIRTVITTITRKSVNTRTPHRRTPPPPDPPLPDTLPGTRAPDSPPQNLLPLPDRPKFRTFFFPLPPPRSLFFFLWEVCSLNFGGVFEGWDPQTCTFEGPVVSNTNKIPREDPQREKKANVGAGEGKKKCEILGGPPSGPHPSSPHAAGPHPSGPHPWGPNFFWVWAPPLIPRAPTPPGPHLSGGGPPGLHFFCIWAPTFLIFILLLICSFFVHFYLFLFLVIFLNFLKFSLFLFLCFFFLKKKNIVFFVLFCF